MKTRIDQSEKISFSFTEEGYLRGRAVVSKTGIFEYLNVDGSIRKELRHPDDVFEKKSIESLHMVPVTVNHPKKLLDLKTASAETVGQTGEKIEIDGKNIICPFTITNEKGIKAFQQGKKELSLGYTCDLIEETGVYESVEYTHRQKSIQYNHLALVDRARAGPQARINLDAATQKREVFMSEKLMPIHLDGLEYQAAPEVKKFLEKLLVEKADAEKSHEDMKKEYDSLKAKLDDLKEKLDRLKSEKTDDAIQAKVKERLGLERKALKVNPKANFDSSSPREILVETIKSKRQNFDASNKSDDYLKAAFDLIVEDFENQKMIHRQKKAATDVVVSDGLDFQKKAHESLTNMWRKRGKLCK